MTLAVAARVGCAPGVPGFGDGAPEPRSAAALAVQGTASGPRLLAGTASVTEFGALGDGVADDTAAIEAALASLAPEGGTLFVPVGTFMVRTLHLPSRVHLVGSGTRETVLMSIAGSNADLIVGAGGEAGTWGASVENLTLHGNMFRDRDHPPPNLAGNTAGRAIYWQTGAGNDPGSSLRVVDVWVTAFAGGPAQGAVQTEGSGWVYLRNVRIVGNDWTSGLYVKSSDGLFEAVYASANGGWSAAPNVVLQGGADNKFIGCYFGGGGSVDQVSLLGSSHNKFLGCTNDNTYGSGYRFRDFAGISSSYNEIIGGHVYSPGQDGRSPAHHVSLEDGTTGVRILGVEFDNPKAIKGEFGVSETGDAGGNVVAACRFGSFAGGPVSLRPGGGTVVTGSIGFPQPVVPVGIANVFTGAGAPDQRVAASVGSLYLRTDGGAGATLYVKETGAGAVGWVPK